MKTKLSGLLALLLIGSGVYAQAYQKTTLGIKTQVKEHEIELQFYSPDIVRVVKYPAGHSFDKQSLSVVLEPGKTPFNVKQQGDELVLDSKKMQVRLDLNSGKIAFSAEGKSLLSEKEAGASFSEFNDAGTKTFSVKQSFVLDKEETIYGLGQQQDARMSKRNVRLNMVQGNTDDYVPFLLSIKAYGLFWDNYSPTVFEDNAAGCYFDSQVGECIDYYFMYGGHADGVIARMRELTGQVPMFPLWTYGFWQSRERYKSQEELLTVVRKYRELEVPLDGIIQDWQYWGNNYLWNAMDFLNPNFPNPQGMVDDVHRLNAHIIISIWNSFGPQTKQYKELEKMNALFDMTTWPPYGPERHPVNQEYPSGVKVYDVYNPKARELYWRYLDKGLFSLGMDGFWIDSSEPDHLNFKPSDFDNQTYLGSFRKVRNAFPLMAVGGVAEQQRAKSSDKRVFILTRSAFAGQQRYGANLWSGDVSASWQALHAQITAGLNVSLSGIPHWNSDIGGFFLWRFRNPLNNPDYRELHVRWMQFGCFCPMMRSHGEGSPREIYQFGQKGNPIYDALEKYIQLRYRLLPYIYSTSYEVSALQSSMMRALMMDFPQDPAVLDLNSEYMFGKALLVCPVTEPMYTTYVPRGRDSVLREDFSKVKTKEVYLPAGTAWYDFWTGEKMDGGRKVGKEVPLDIMPLYVRAGSILPWGPKVQYATEQNWDQLEIRVYPGADGEFVLYEDEFDNYNYENGAYSTISFKWDDKQKALTIGARQGNFPGMLLNRSFRIVFVEGSKGSGPDSSEHYDQVVKYSGKKVVVRKR